MYNIAIIFSLVLVAGVTATAYGDHVDRHIWIETAEDTYVKDSESIQTDKITYDGPTHFFYNRNYCGIRIAEPQQTLINGAIMLDQRYGCGNTTTEKEYYSSSRIGRSSEEKHHNCTCGYWYHNVVKNEYTYAIIDLPRDRVTPTSYKEIVRAGVDAGLDRWGDINNIGFRYTDSRLDADIIIQQQIGNGRTYGNAEIGCLFENQQCTIQLFTDMNVNKQQTLVNKNSIEWTVAHEFGHLIGLPHHIEPDNIMNTIQDSDIRTYYETHNINVPNMIEPTYEQRLLGHEGNQTNTTDNSISKITEHEKFTEFIEYISQVIRNTPKDDRLGLWWDISSEISDKIWNVIFDWN